MAWDNTSDLRGILDREHIEVASRAHEPSLALLSDGSLDSLECSCCNEQETVIHDGPFDQRLWHSRGNVPSLAPGADVAEAFQSYRSKVGHEVWSPLQVTGVPSHPNLLSSLYAAQGPAPRPDDSNN